MCSLIPVRGEQWVDDHFRSKYGVSLGVNEDFFIGQAVRVRIHKVLSKLVSPFNMYSRILWILTILKLRLKQGRLKFAPRFEPGQVQYFDLPWGVLIYNRPKMGGQGSVQLQDLVCMTVAQLIGGWLVPVQYLRECSQFAKRFRDFHMWSRYNCYRSMKKHVF